MRRNLIRYIAVTLLPACFITLLAGCSAEDMPAHTPGTADKIPLEILLKQPDGLTVEANGSRANTSATLEGITISDVWVVQFNATGEAACLACKYYSSGINNIDNYKAQVTTGNDFSNVESNFYIIVNAGASFLTADDTSITEDSLKKKAVKTADSSGPIFDTSNAPLQLVAGPVKFKPIASTETGITKNASESKGVQAVLLAPLERPYAKLEIKYTSSGKGTFTPTSLKIKNLPKSLYVCKGEGTYPATGDISDAEQTIWSSGSTWEATDPQTCYIGENLRGSGTATIAKEKGIAAKGPGGTLTGCTYITLTGTYKYASGHAAGITVAYTIYLGGDLISDYNLQRNNLYAITIHIGGANSADIRVAVTNGNVGYYEEVKEVKPDYEVIL